jgi:hypothetical protein
MVPVAVFGKRLRMQSLKKIGVNPVGVSNTEKEPGPNVTDLVCPSLRVDKDD